MVLFGLGFKKLKTFILIPNENEVASLLLPDHNIGQTSLSSLFHQLKISLPFKISKVAEVPSE